MVRARRMPVWGAALVVALAVACGSREPMGPEGSGVRAGAAGTASLPAPQAPPARLYPLVVAAGREVVVLGGASIVARHADRPLAGGEVLHPGANSWSSLSGGPLAGPIVYPGAVWTGTEVLVAATPCAEPLPEEDTDRFCSDQKVEFMTIDAPSGRVRALPPPGALGTFRPWYPPLIRGLGWTGREAVFLFAQGIDFRFLLYDPVTARWRRAPDLPSFSPHRTPSVCVSGSSLWEVWIPETGPPVPGPIQAGPIKMWRLDARSSSWAALPERPFPGTVPAQALPYCANGEIVVVASNADASIRVLWFDPVSEHWDETPPMPRWPSDRGLVTSAVGSTPLRVDGARVLWTAVPATRYFVLPTGGTEWVAHDKPTGFADDSLAPALPLDGKILTRSATLGGGQGAPKVVDPVGDVAGP